jgi:hypothetical protein
MWFLQSEVTVVEELVNGVEYAAYTQESGL